MKHTIGIEPDEDENLPVAGNYKIVIRRKSGDETSTPLRGVDENTARAMLPAVSSAFLCGVRSARWITTRAIDHIELNNAPDVAIVVKKTTP